MDEPFPGGQPFHRFFQGVPKVPSQPQGETASRRYPSFHCQPGKAKNGWNLQERGGTFVARRSSPVKIVMLPSMTWKSWNFGR